MERNDHKKRPDCHFLTHFERRNPHVEAVRSHLLGAA
nr:MAG TPA: hypothetical protein [Caudoviricetes sp.]